MLNARFCADRRIADMWSWKGDSLVEKAFLDFTLLEKWVIIVWAVLPLLREFFGINLLGGLEVWLRQIIEITPAIRYFGLDYILDFEKLANVLPWVVATIFTLRFPAIKTAFLVPRIPPQWPGAWVGWMLSALFAIALVVSVYAPPIYNEIEAAVESVTFVKSINVTALHQIQVTLLFFYALLWV